MRFTRFTLVGTLAIVAACGSKSPAPTSGDRALLLDPATCQTCHPSHYAQWAASMHAYASDDPVFVAMNKRGQRETGGKLGDFCVKCHAPMAVRQGLTTDGLNLATLPQSAKGVSCYFCHSIDSVNGAHDDPLVLANDLAMAGAIQDPVSNPLHKSRYSPYLDSNRTEASAACGSCHDIVNPNGAAIERTFAEWQQTVFARPFGGQGCGNCHMATSDGQASNVSTKPRKLHDHGFPGVDVALGPWPGMAEQKQAISQQLNVAVQAALCLDERTNRIRVVLDNVGVGHMWPSGASSDRRAWLEVIAYAGGQPIYQSGVVADGSSLADLNDPDLLLMRDCFYDDTGKDVHMFWQATKVTSNLLPGGTILTASTPQSQYGHRRWDLPRPDSARKLPQVPDRITMRVRLHAVGDDVLRELEQSGDLDTSIPAAVPTYDIPGGTVEWTKQTANFTYLENGSIYDCVAPPAFNSTTNATISQAQCTGGQPASDGGVPPAGADAGAAPDGGASVEAGAFTTCAQETRADHYTAGLEKMGFAGKLNFKLLASDPAPPIKGTNTWTLEVDDPAGTLQSGGMMGVKTYMPDHGHGSTVKPVITPLPDGRFKVTPLYLFMAGLWEVTFDVTTPAGVSDSAVFRICVDD